MLNVKGTGTHISLGLLPRLTFVVCRFLKVRQLFQQTFPVCSLVRKSASDPSDMLERKRMQKSRRKERA